MMREDYKYSDITEKITLWTSCMLCARSDLKLAKEI